MGNLGLQQLLLMYLFVCYLWNLESPRLIALFYRFCTTLIILFYMIIGIIINNSVGIGRLRIPIRCLFIVFSNYGQI